MKKYLFAIALGAMTVAACNKAEVEIKEVKDEPVGQKVTLIATGEAYGSDTKATLDGAVTKWELNDEIAVHVYKGTAYGKDNVDGGSGFKARDITFRLADEDAGKASGKFVCTEDLDEYHHWGYAALYPQFDSNVGGDAKVYFHMQKVYENYVSGRNFMPMVANLNIEPAGLGGRPSELNFKHVGAGIRVTFKDVPATCGQASLTVAGKKIAGDAVWYGVDPANAGTDALEAADSDNADEQTVYIKFPTAAEARDITFIFPLPTVDLAGGFTIKLWYKVGDDYVAFWGLPATSKAEKTLPTLTRGQVLDMGEVTVANVKSVPFSESFAEDKGSFTIKDEANTLGSDVWTHAQYGADKFMKATSYSGGNHNAESWLISPIILMPSLKQGEALQLSFKHAINKFFGTVENEATLQVKTIDAEEWTKIDISYPELGSTSFTSFEAQKVNLNFYAGKRIQVAFKYVGSTEAAGTWEVNNVSLVKTPALSSIAVSGQKTVFEQDEPFVFGGTVTATYADATEADVTASASFTGYDMSTPGVYTVTVSYTENGLQKETTYDITVTPPVVWDLREIAVTTPPTITVYAVGDKFNPSGMVVTATYEDHANTSNTKEETVDIEDLEFYPSTTTALTVEDTYITITYNGKSTNQAITVKTGQWYAEDWSEVPAKASYTKGDEEFSGSWGTWKIVGGMINSTSLDEKGKFSKGYITLGKYADNGGKGPYLQSPVIAGGFSKFKYSAWSNGASYTWTVQVFAENAQGQTVEVYKSEGNHVTTKSSDTVQDMGEIVVENATKNAYILITRSSDNRRVSFGNFEIFY